MWRDFIAFHAQRHADREALFVVAEQKRVSYGELHRQSDQWAHCLHKHGVKFGDPVCLLANNCLEHITLLFACSRLGAIFVPLNTRLALAELKEQLANIEPKLALTDGDRDLPDGVPWQRIQDQPLEQTAPFPTVNLEMQDPVLMLFTSGSTGMAKGVILHAGMLLWNMINTQTGWDLNADDISVIHTPFFHTGGYNVTGLPLLRLGGHLILVDRFEAQSMLRIIERERVSVFFAVPTMFQSMMACPDFANTDFSKLKWCISGGAPLPVSVIKAYEEQNVPFKQGFGMTEVGPNCFSMTCEEASLRPESVGRPVLHSEVKLVDESDREVTPGVIGELCIRGPHLCKGYWKQDALFQSLCAGGFFHTGDLMRRDEQGFYYVVGRKKDMYISGGENVYPGEVQRKLLLHPDIGDALVFAVPDQHWGEVGFAFLRTEIDLELIALREFLNPLLSRYKHPHHVCCLAEFPVLANGKLDRAALTLKAQEQVAR